ncbi:MAG: GWxTD domain-containing protein [Gemmatimonadaceae bacterium]
MASLAALLLLLPTISVSAAQAQVSKKPTPTTPAPTGSVALSADSIANAADSLAAHAMLDSVFRSSKLDAVAAHKFAMYAWNMARSPHGLDANRSKNGVRWSLAADSAFHLAVTLAPDSAMYWRDLARFGMSSGYAFTRAAAESWVENGLAAAVRMGDSLMVSDLADEAGMVKWHRYENLANRALEILDYHVFSKEQAEFGVAIRRDQVVKPDKSFSGYADYADAVNLFRRASANNAVNARARRHLYMAQAERAQWTEMLRASNAQIKVAPWDFEAWLARGLASQRLFQSKDAAAAFDSAMVLMTPEQVASYKRFTRILPVQHVEGKSPMRDSVAFDKMSVTERNATEEMAWALLDPLAATPENEYRTEFYARVAFADLRWTAEDLGYRGSNTDRGDIHVRYGPADLELGIPAERSGIEMSVEDPIYHIRLRPSDLVVLWRYNNGLSFVFTQPPMFGTAHLGDKEMVAVAEAERPISFANVPISKLIDTMTVRVTAFRGVHDSLDVVVAAVVPVGRMVKGVVDLGGELPLNLSARVIDGFAKVSQIKSSTLQVNSAAVPERIPANWIQRVGGDVNFVRVEAYQPDTRKIARGVLNVAARPTTGFGMSDILLGDKLAESNTAASRWTDVKMEPVFGTYHVGEPIAMLWENYQLAADNGNVRYKVNIIVQPRTPNGIQGLVARVRSAFGATLGQGKDNGAGAIDVSFPRTAPARDVLVESMSLDLGKAKPGIYFLKIEITDDVTKTKTSRVTLFRVEN